MPITQPSSASVTVCTDIILYCQYYPRSKNTKSQSNAFSGCLTDQQVWFPVDFKETFLQKISRICSFIDIYRTGSLTPGITLILFTQAIAELKDIYWGLIAPISINHGLLQDVFTGTLRSTRILSQPENFQETLLISSRFPGNYSSISRSVKTLWFSINVQLQYLHVHHVLCNYLVTGKLFVVPELPEN